MKRVHPNLNGAIICATIALSLNVGGCRSSSSGIAGSPLLAPDRVAPPSTRTLLPGQAQPYYPGDPLPAMQSAIRPPANAVAANTVSPNTVPANPAEAETRTPTGRTLAWNAPAAAAPAATAAAAPPSAPVSPPPQQTIAAASEGSVAVPNDSNPLRFELPPPQQPASPAPVAVSPPPANTEPIQPLQPIQPALQTQQGVMLASYTAPVAKSPAPLPAPPPAAPTVTAPPQVSSPWRSPQVLQPSAAPTYATQPVTLQPQSVAPLALPAPPTIMPMQQQFATPTNAMGVSLRAVPPPPPQPGDPMPRVRMPGYVDQQTSVADGFRSRTSMQ